MISTMFNVENFFDKNNLNLWHVKTLVLFTYQECEMMLKGEANLLGNLISSR